MLVLGPTAWLVGMLGLSYWPAVGSSRAAFGAGIGALLAALLIAAAETGSFAANTLPNAADGSVFTSYMTGQLVWVVIVVLGAAGYGLSRIARRLPPRSLVLAAEVVAIALTSALLLASTDHGGWLVPLAPLAAGALAATVVGRQASAVVATTVAFVLTLAAVAPLALIPNVAAVSLGILGATYAIGRWTDLHAAAATPPDLLMYGSLAAGFVLVYWRPAF